MKKIEGVALGLATTLLFACGGSDFSAADTHPGGGAGMASAAGSGGTAGMGLGGSAGSEMAGAGNSYSGPAWIDGSTGKIEMRGLTGTLADYSVDFSVDSWGDEYWLMVSINRNGEPLGYAYSNAQGVFPLDITTNDGVASLSLSLVRPCPEVEPTCNDGRPTLDSSASDFLSMSMIWCPVNGGECSDEVPALSAMLLRGDETLADWSL